MKVLKAFFPHTSEFNVERCTRMLPDWPIQRLTAAWCLHTTSSFCLPPIRAGWVDCWSVPNFLLIIDYTWHPIYPQKADEQLKQSCKLAALTLRCGRQ